jgi:hypothetical protein
VVTAIGIEKERETMPDEKTFTVKVTRSETRIIEVEAPDEWYARDLAMHKVALEEFDGDWEAEIVEDETHPADLLASSQDTIRIPMTPEEKRWVEWAINEMRQQPPERFEDLGYTANDLPIFEGDELTIRHSALWALSADFHYRLNTKAYNMATGVPKAPRQTVLAIYNAADKIGTAGIDVASAAQRRAMGKP